MLRGRQGKRVQFLIRGCRWGGSGGFGGGWWRGESDSSNREEERIDLCKNGISYGLVGGGGVYFDGALDEFNVV